MTDTGWICLDRLDTAFKVVLTPGVSFFKAIGACVADGGTLTSIRDFQDWNGIISVGSTLGATEQDFWIGVEAKVRFTENSQAATPTNYEFLDGTNSSFFNVTRGDFPWRDKKPFDRLDRQCVAMNPTTVTKNLDQLGWENHNCEEDLGYVCRRPCTAAISISESSNSGWAPILGISIVLIMVAVLLFGWKEMKNRKQIQELQETLAEQQRATKDSLVKSPPPVNPVPSL